MAKASALPPCRYRIKAQRLSAAEGFYNSVWAMGLEAQPIAAGFVFSALNHTSPIHIYLSTSLCATPRSPFHCKLAYIHCLIFHLTRCWVNQSQRQGATQCSCLLRGLNTTCPSAEPLEPLTAYSCPSKFKAEPLAQQQSHPHQISRDWPEDQKEHSN